MVDKQMEKPPLMAQAGSSSYKWCNRPTDRLNLKGDHRGLKLIG